ncbi:MAG: biopolymer transporter ExbD [Clostridium sp.]|nr:biopolymer transporter ExbD [Clostridium sp.]
MALKRQHDMMSLFSMASMTDVIFLLLIFFMVTSTFVFPTALDITLPQSSEQVAIRPTTRIYLTGAGDIYVSLADSEPETISDDALRGFLAAQSRENPASVENIAVYADKNVTYGRLVSILDIGAQSNLKMVLATKPAPVSARPDSGEN